MTASPGGGGAGEEEAARLEDPVIACLGLAFSADVDDLESPRSGDHGAACRGGRRPDPGGGAAVSSLPSKLTALGVVAATLEAALAEADILVLLVDHRQFREVDPSAYAGSRRCRHPRHLELGVRPGSAGRAIPGRALEGLPRL